MSNGNKTVLITGATSGLGEALLQRYVKEGYRVIACGRNQQKLAQWAQHKAVSHTLAFDVNNGEAIEEAAGQIGAVDILILNAGACQYIDKVMQFNAALFTQVITTNLLSMGDLLRCFLPKLTPNGQLVFISSSATIVPFPRAEAYGASKAGLDYLARSLRLDLQPQGIAVTLVHPGFIKTPLTDKNTFAMPFILSAADAAQRIFKGIKARKNELYFPKRLTLLLKLFAVLPAGVWRALVLRNLTI